MRILYLTFYFKPDLGPGAFRNTALVDELAQQLTSSDELHVITTQPNRYQSFRPLAFNHEERFDAGCRVRVERVAVPAHSSGQIGQAFSFWTYFRAVHRLTKNNQYDLVVASSSRLFTAFLGARLARKKRIPLFLDVRDIFRAAILDVFKVPFAGLLLNPVLRLIERYTFGYARHINLVSEGFRSYFNSFPQATYSFFMNGIDEQFLDMPRSYGLRPSPKILLYAGNIGEGQGLHKIIPQAARQLGDGYCFLIIGAGSARQKLKTAIQTAGVTNVELWEPVSQQELPAIYQQVDYLFVHLNDLAACKQVLPSKLVEYGATDKPIVAGVAGYAASFVREHLENSLVFNPGDVTDLVNQLGQTPYRTQVRTRFREQFQRKTISRAMAHQMLQTISAPAAGPDAIDLDKFETAAP